MRRRRATEHRQRGAATVPVIAMAGVLLVVGTAASAVGALVVDHRRAQAAADLAALAGADALASRAGDPCAEAAAIAEADGARLRRCDVSGAVVDVEVVVDGPRWWGREPQLAAHARAGPDTADAGAPR